MKDLQIIKGVECYIDENGVAQLNLEHVARGLGFTQSQVKNGKEYASVRWERVDKYLESVGVSVSPTSGGRPEYIPEPIFYLLAMKADNQTAREFQKMVAYDILPTIRRHGMYARDELLENPDLLIEVATQLKQERQQRKALENKVEKDAPKVLFADAVAASHTSILTGELAKLLKQNGVDIGQNRLFAWLRENGYLIRRTGTDYNMPTQRSMELGLFEVKERVINDPGGSTRVIKTPKVTGKGQQYFINKFLGERKAAC